MARWVALGCECLCGGSGSGTGSGCLNCCDPLTFQPVSFGGIIPDDLCCHIEFTDPACGHPASVDVDLIYDSGLGLWYGDYSFTAPFDPTCAAQGGLKTFALNLFMECCTDSHGESRVSWYLVYDTYPIECGLTSPSYNVDCPSPGAPTLTATDITLEPFYIEGSDAVTPFGGGLTDTFTSAHFIITEGPC